MNAPSVDVKNFLELNGVGTFAAQSGWGIYISREPNAPDTCITLYDTGGYEPLYNGGIEYPTIQIRVRGAPNDYINTQAKINSIKQLLLSSDGSVINQTKYDFWIQGDVAFLEYDDSSRPIFVLNFRLQRSEI